MTENESINGWTFEETVKIAENLMEAESNMLKWDILRHLRDFLENYKDELEKYRAIGTIDEFKALKVTQKMIEKSNFCLEQYRADTDTAYQCGYNKAIDEFVNRLERYEQENWVNHLEYGINWSDIEHIVQEMKAGGTICK